jgi:hypothetical protein
MATTAKPLEIHIDRIDGTYSGKYYKVSILHEFCKVSVRFFVSLKKSREYIVKQYGKNHNIPILR